MLSRVRGGSCSRGVRRVALMATSSAAAKECCYSMTFVGGGEQRRRYFEAAAGVRSPRDQIDLSILRHLRNEPFCVESANFLAPYPTGHDLHMIEMRRVRSPKLSVRWPLPLNACF